MINRDPIQTNLKHIQLKKSLYDAITNGDLKSGEKLPSQEKIAEVYKVSIGTVREAITSLVHEGLLDRIQGKGTFVSEFKKKPVALALVIPRLCGNIMPFHGAGNEVTLLLAQAVESAARKMGANTLLYLYHDDMNLERESLKNVLNLGVDGLIIIHMGDKCNIDYLNMIADSGAKVLFMDTHIPETNFDYITSNNEMGAYKAVECLIKKGYKRIIHITRRRKVSSLVERYEGYLKAMNEASLPVKVEYISEELVEASMVENDACEIAERIFKEYEFPLAVFTADAPSMAVAFKALNKNKIEYQSGDLALACFDEANIQIPDGVLFVNVVQKLHEVGTQAVEAIMRKLSGETERICKKIEPDIKITDRRC